MKRQSKVSPYFVPSVRVRRSAVSHLTAEHSKKPFTTFARWVSFIAGQPYAFILALFLIILWGVIGPMFGYSNTWQLVINTTTTIVTFLMVFLIQNSQNRDSQAMQIKLDELIRTTEGAHTALLDLEELTEPELLAIKEKYEHLALQARTALRKGKSDRGTPEI
ncbi:low affinity iron permease family protein [Candidatus Peregrinibacteria bacterium]|nr:low affinity iron permease family protein [Candidatus Peregrinibacteria bacterium]